MDIPYRFVVYIFSLEDRPIWLVYYSFRTYNSRSSARDNKSGRNIKSAWPNVWNALDYKFRFSSGWKKKRLPLNHNLIVSEWITSPTTCGCLGGHI